MKEIGHAAKVIWVLLISLDRVGCDHNHHFMHVALLRELLTRRAPRNDLIINIDVKIEAEFPRAFD
jgi:hypothetical protein